MSREEIAAVIIFNPIRFEIDPAACPYTWEEYKMISGITPREAARLEKKARKQKSLPNTWYVSFNPFPAETWINGAHYNKRVWRVLALDDDFISTLAGWSCQ